MGISTENSSSWSRKPASLTCRASASCESRYQTTTIILLRASTLTSIELQVECIDGEPGPAERVGRLFYCSMKVWLTGLLPVASWQEGITSSSSTRWISPRSSIRWSEEGNEWSHIIIMQQPTVPTQAQTYHQLHTKPNQASSLINWHEQAAACITFIYLSGYTKNSIW